MSPPVQAQLLQINKQTNKLIKKQTNKRQTLIHLSQVLPHRVRHIRSQPSSHEIFYEPSGKEAQPRPIGELGRQLAIQPVKPTIICSITLICRRGARCDCLPVQAIEPCQLFQVYYGQNRIVSSAKCSVLGLFGFKSLLGESNIQHLTTNIKPHKVCESFSH